MIEIYRTQDRDFLAKFFVREKVWELSSSYKPWTEEEFVMNSEVLYLVAAEDGDVIGVCTIEQATCRTAEMHWQIARKYWGKGKSDLAMTEVKKVLHSTLKYDRIMTSAPHLCVEVVRALERNGAEFIGKIDKGTAFKGEVCDLLFFSMNIENCTE